MYPVDIKKMKSLTPNVCAISFWLHLFREKQYLGCMFWSAALLMTRQNVVHSPKRSLAVTSGTLNLSQDIVNLQQAQFI